MKKITLTLAIACLFLMQISVAQELYKRVTINGVNNQVISQLDELGIDMTCGVSILDNSMTLELGEKELQRIQQKGIRYRVLVEDLTKFYSDRAVQNLPKASSEIAQEKALKQTQRSFSVSEIINNVGQYDECDEIDWTVPSNWNLNDPANYPSETNHFGGCLTYDMVLDELDDMRAQYPNLISARIDASPTSQQTVEGRTIWYLRISDNPDIDEAEEPETLYQSLIHSRESATIMNQLYFMWYLLENYATDPAIQNLVNNHALYFIPVFNPDGFVYNETVAPNGGGFQRKNRNTSGGCTTYADGIDLNRNSAYYWGNGGASTNTCSDTYLGTAPFSENETQIMRDFFLLHDFEIALNHHSFKNAMLHAYAGTSITNPRPDEYAKYNHDMTQYNRYAYGPSTSISGLNSGNMNDWMLGGPAGTSANGTPTGTGSGKNTLAWTPENGLSSESTIINSGFWPDPSNFMPIAKRAMRMNFLAAYFSGKYAKLHDLNLNEISTTSGNFQFGIENLGQNGNDATPNTNEFTVTVTAVSGNVTINTATATENFTAAQILEQRTVNIPYTLDPGIQPNDEIVFKVVLTNDYASDNVLYEANITKYYQPTVLFSDAGDDLSNWNATTGTWFNTTDAFSGNAITTHTTAPYSNNQTKVLEMANPVNLAGIPTTLIQYYAKWDIERSFDYVQLEGSTDGSNWVPLCGKLTKPGAPDANNTYSATNDAGDSTTKFNSDRTFQPDGEPLYDGDTQDKWNMEEVVIDNTTNSSLYNQSTVYLRFVFRSESSNRKDSYANADFEGFSFDEFRIVHNATNLSQTITFDPIADKFTTDSDFTVNATASSGLPVSYAIVSGPATISGNTVSLTGAVGTVIVRASQSGNATYAAASDVDESFEVTIEPPCSGVLVNTYPYSESFEGSGSGGLGGWTQDTTDNFDWTINSGGTPTNNTGPSAATDGSYYVFTETGTSSGVATITSPCFDLNGLTSADFSYAYHMDGANMGVMTLEISTDDGSSWTQIWTENTNLGAAWQTNTIDLSSYLNNYVKFRFSGDMPNTGSSTSDMAIDDIGLTAVMGSSTWYQDADNDGFGNPSVSQVAVNQPAGYVADNTDCDDTNADEFPGQTWYSGVDNDGDGFFGSVASVTQCEEPESSTTTPPGLGWSTSPPTVDDCNDSDNTINATVTYFVDSDLDGFGSTMTEDLCSNTAPAGYSTNNTDCDDTDANEYPGQTWYIDADGDDYGASSQTACERPTDGFLLSELSGNGTDDCDDTDANEYPGQTWYVGVDNDGDGFFGSTNSVTQCESPGANYATSPQTTDDCDDNDPNEFPGQTWYVGVDNDGDGFFGSTNSVTQCESPGANYATSPQTTNDCDDNDPDEFPGQTWYVGVDNDGDGFFGSTNSVTQCESPGANYATSPQTTDDCDDNDPDEFPGQTWYVGVDNDGDGFFGSTNSVTQCESPGANYATSPQTTNDCDDNDPDEFPGQTWYVGVDNDGDGFFGSTNSVTQCESPGANYATSPQTTNDCDDNDPDEFPGQTWYVGVDNDGDGFFGSTNSVTQCESPGANYATSPQTTDDCDDNDPDEFPGQTWYVGVDNDGDGFFGSTNSVTQCESPGANYATSPQTTNDCDDNDPDEFPGQTWYVGVDNDGDGFFGSTNSVTQCESPGANYATSPQTTDDCDDNDPDEFPGQTWYVGVDNDGDGFFGSTNSVTQCESPGANYATSPQTTDDCDDNDPDEFPGQTWYVGVDNDGDGFFGSTNSVTQCESPGANYATSPQTTDDCDDNDPDEFPGQTWYVGVDNDGDGFFGSTNSVTQCESPGANYATSPQTTDDCDDNDPDEFPGQTWYVGVDNDGDGFFGSTNSVTQCESPGANYATSPQTTDDCDDNDPDEFPGQTWYVGVDNDGDGFFGSTNSVTQCESPGANYATSPQTTNDCDDNDPDEFPGQTWYVGVDNDGDGFFGSTNSVTQCESPGANYATSPQTTDDCDDNDPDEFPGQTWYVGVDNDGDGFFGSTNSVTQCESPGANYATSPQTTDDCDDNDPDEFPGQTWYVGVDNDGDGFFGSTNSVTQCESPGANYATSPQTTDDCDDNDPDEFPGQTWYVGVDNDGDGFFGSTNSVTQCESPGANYATSPQTTDDCDDNDPDEFPGQTWYVGVDNDGDGFFGSTNSVTQCESPGANYATSPQTTDDCDDNDPDEFPGQTWYVGVDNDGDGFFGSTNSVTQCESPGANYATSPQTTDDCDDNDPDEFPGQTWYIDADGDDYGASSQTACERPTDGFLLSELSGNGTDDCDDGNPSRNPSAFDIPNNGIDEDCNGSDNTTLGTDDNDFKRLSVSPNPFKDHINIIVPSQFRSHNFKVEIYDLNGRIVYSKTQTVAVGSIKIVDIDKLEQAPYLIRVLNLDNGMLMNKRLIKL